MDLTAAFVPHLLLFTQRAPRVHKGTEGCIALSPGSARKADRTQGAGSTKWRRGISSGSNSRPIAGRSQKLNRDNQLFAGAHRLGKRTPDEGPARISDHALPDLGEWTGKSRIKEPIASVPPETEHNQHLCRSSSFNPVN